MGALRLVKTAAIVSSMISTVAVLSSPVFGQQAPLPEAKHGAVDLQRVDVSHSSNEEARSRYAELPAGFMSLSAMHPGEELVYVISGDYTLHIPGQPDKNYKTGGSLSILRGVRHSFSSVGGAKLLVVWIVDKDLPLDINVEKAAGARP